MKYIFTCILAILLFIACKKEEKDTLKSTLLFETYLGQIVNENGKINSVWVDFYLFDANNTIYTEHQDAEKLRQLQAIDNNGIIHRICKVLSPQNGTAHLYVEPGRYFIVLQLHETGRFTHKYIDIKEGDLLQVQKIFTSALPENSFEEW